MSQIKVIRTLDELEALKPTWDRLFAANHRLRVFQTYDWNRIVWENYHLVESPDETLYVIHAVHDGKYKYETILPFCRTGKGQLRFIGYMMADVLDAISPAHSDNWHVFYAEIIDFLTNRSDIADVQLWKMESDSEVLLYFGVHWPNVSIHYQDSYSYFYAAQDATFEDAFSHLSSSGRSKLRRISGKFPDLTLKIYSKRCGSEYPRDQIKKLRDWMIANDLRVYAACPDSYLNSMEALYAQGLCEVSVLESEDGEFQYAGFRLLICNHIVFWVVLYRDARMTSVANVRYFVEKVREGAYCYDFGTGAYSYKLITFRPMVGHLYSISVHPLNLRNFLFDTMTLLRRYVKAWLVQLRLRRK